jgi:hypothetical protein
VHHDTSHPSKHPLHTAPSLVVSNDIIVPMQVANWPAASKAIRSQDEEKGGTLECLRWTTSTISVSSGKQSWPLRGMFAHQLCYMYARVQELMVS